jgi:hypothetical protein
MRRWSVNKQTNKQTKKTKERKTPTKQANKQTKQQTNSTSEPTNRYFLSPYWKHNENAQNINRQLDHGMTG